MIKDLFSNLERYNIPHASAITAFVTQNNCLDLPNGQITIDHEDLFVRVMEYLPKEPRENRFETHRRYADVQYIVKGIELMQIIPSDGLTAVSDHDNAGDYQFFKGDAFISDLVVREGEFTYFHPGEAHRPSCIYKECRQAVKKLVFKVRIF